MRHLSRPMRHNSRQPFIWSHGLKWHVCPLDYSSTATPRELERYVCPPARFPSPTSHHRHLPTKNQTLIPYVVNDDNIRRYIDEIRETKNRTNKKATLTENDDNEEGAFRTHNQSFRTTTRK